MVDINAPVYRPRSRAELAARREAKLARRRRRRLRGVIAALACCGLCLLPVMAASAGASAPLPQASPQPASTAATPPPSAACPIPDAARMPLQQAAAQAGLQLSLVAAVAQTESAFDPQARSGAGAQGLMQLEPATAAAYGVSDPYDPYENAAAAARYLRDLLARYRQSLPLALAAYNAGPTAVDNAGGVPDYPETVAYVAKVSALEQALRPCR